MIFRELDLMGKIMLMQILRKEYIDSFKRNLRGQLNNISIKEKDGSITNLGEKFGSKKGN